MQRKFGLDSDLADVVNSLEKKPDSKGRTAAVQEEIESIGAAKDLDLLKLAEALHAALKQGRAGDHYQAILCGSGAIAQDGRTAAAFGEGGTAISGDGEGDITVSR